MLSIMIDKGLVKRDEKTFALRLPCSNLPRCGGQADGEESDRQSLRRGRDESGAARPELSNSHARRTQRSSAISGSDGGQMRCYQPLVPDYGICHHLTWLGAGSFTLAVIAIALS